MLMENMLIQNVIYIKNKYIRHLSKEISAFLKGELMLKKIKKKIIYIFMIIMILFSNLQNIVLAKEIGESAKLKSIGQIGRAHV